MENDKRIRVLLADNHPIVRAGIRAQLEKIPAVEVVGEANDGRDAVEMVDNLQPNVVFMDITMPNLNGLEATKRITQKRLTAAQAACVLHLTGPRVTKLLDANIDEFTLDELAAIATNEPNRFSPSVVLRSVVQDYLLPTVCYFGGAAEVNGTGH